MTALVVEDPESRPAVIPACLSLARSSFPPTETEVGYEHGEEEEEKPLRIYRKLQYLVAEQEKREASHACGGVADCYWVCHGFTLLESG